MTSVGLPLDNSYHHLWMSFASSTSPFLRLSPIHSPYYYSGFFLKKKIRLGEL
jgi:hypothetical protein